MRNTAFLAIGVLPARRPGEPVSACSGYFGLHGATPSLLLPLIVFMGVHETRWRAARRSRSRSATCDGPLAAAPIGLFTFIGRGDLVARAIAGVRLAAQTC